LVNFERSHLALNDNIKNKGLEKAGKGCPHRVREGDSILVRLGKFRLVLLAI